MALLGDLFTSYKTLDLPEHPEVPVSFLGDIDPFMSKVAVAQDRMDSMVANRQRHEAELQDAVAAENAAKFAAENTVDNNTEFTWDSLFDSAAWDAGAETDGEFDLGFEYTPTGTATRYSRGNLAAEVRDLFAKEGIKVIITSGKRKAGAAGKAGSRSHHVLGNAVDIVPGKGETFDSIREKMVNNPQILQFFYENGLGVIDETDPETMRKTGATGKHFHIGPDKWATQTWGNWTKSVLNIGGDRRRTWTRDLYVAYAKALKDKYGSAYDNDTYRRIASYMTYQSAAESGYGEHANGFNYGGHMRNGKVLRYDTLDSFVKAQVRTLNKWDVMNASSLRDYVERLYKNKHGYQYNPSQTPSEYYDLISGTRNRVNGYLGFAPQKRQGGKFDGLRIRYNNLRESNSWI